MMYKFIQQTIQPGPSVSLKCIAAGNPTPSIKWTLDGFPLPQHERRVDLGHLKITLTPALALTHPSLSLFLLSATL